MKTKVVEIDPRSLYRRQDVRDELQILRKRIKARFDSHLKETGDRALTLPMFADGHDQRVCNECWNFRGQLAGIAEALRTFGGRETK